MHASPRGTKPGAVPIKQLQSIRPAGPEHKYGAPLGECDAFTCRQWLNGSLCNAFFTKAANPSWPLRKSMHCPAVHACMRERGLGRHHDPHPVRWKDHPAAFNARTISAIRAAGVAASNRSVTSPRITSKTSAKGAGSATGSWCTKIGANPKSSATAGKTNLPVRARRRHSDTWFGRISYRRATAWTVAPSTNVSATI